MGDEEALMVASVGELPVSIFDPISAAFTVKVVANEEMIDDLLAVEAAVWKKSNRTRDENPGPH